MKKIAVWMLCMSMLIRSGVTVLAANTLQLSELQVGATLATGDIVNDDNGSFLMVYYDYANDGVGANPDGQEMVIGNGNFEVGKNATQSSSYWKISEIGENGFSWSSGSSIYMVLIPTESVETEGTGGNDEEDEAYEKRESNPGCTSHNYAWEQTNAATTTKDGEKVYRCQNCGHVADKVKISAYGVFLEEVTEKIKNAPAGSVVEIKTDLWVSFSKAVAAALQANPTVTLVVEFFYDGHVFQIIIPAGYDLMAKMNEDGYAGFAYLATDPALKLMWLR